MEGVTEGGECRMIDCAEKRGRSHVIGHALDLAVVASVRSAVAVRQTEQRGGARGRRRHPALSCGTTVSLVLWSHIEIHIRTSRSQWVRQAVSEVADHIRIIPLPVDYQN